MYSQVKYIYKEVISRYSCTNDSLNTPCWDALEPWIVDADTVWKG